MERITPNVIGTTGEKKYGRRAPIFWYMVAKSPYDEIGVIQDCIARMASCSFAMKFFTVLIVVAVVVGGHGSPWLVLPVIAFWGLDAYYLRQERMFRKLFDYTISTDEDRVVQEINPNRFAGAVDSWIEKAFSKTLLLFYPVMIAVLFLLW